MLHIIQKQARFGQCLAYANPSDIILCIEEAVYCILMPHISILKYKIYVLEEDIIARGLKKYVPTGIDLINYHGFVDLVAAHATTQTWF